MKTAERFAALEARQDAADAKLSEILAAVKAKPSPGLNSEWIRPAIVIVLVIAVVLLLWIKGTVPAEFMAFTSGLVTGWWQDRSNQHTATNTTEALLTDTRTDATERNVP